jgi:hypothetical protein
VQCFANAFIAYGQFINASKIFVKQHQNDKGNKKFQIDNTSIGKTNFQSINLSSFTEIKIFDNIFTEIDYTNIIWSDKVVGVGQYNNDTSKLSKQQDSYRTLKNVALRNNDQPQAVKFICMLIKPQSRSIRPRVAFISFDQFSIKFHFFGIKLYCLFS